MATMKLDQSKLNFSATAAEFSRPNLKFDLDLDQIDLDRYLPPSSEQPPPEKSAAAGKPAGQKIDYTPLRRMILDGKAKIGNLTVSKARIQDVLLQIKAKDGIIKLDPMQLKMYQGTADGNVLLNVAGNAPKSDLNLKISGIQANPLLKDVLAKDFLEGNTNADIQLSMVRRPTGPNQKNLKRQRRPAVQRRRHRRHRSGANGPQYRLGLRPCPKK